MRRRWICHADDCAKGNVFHKNTTICELPNGDLLSGWFAGAVGEGNRDQNSYYSRLPAGAEEWTDAELLTGVEGRAVGSPIIFEGAGDYLWATSPVVYGDWLTGSRLFYKRSSDGGQTWGDLELLYHERGVYLKNKPIHLEPEDRWVLPAYSTAEDKPHFFLIPGDDHERPGDAPVLVGGEEIVGRDESGYMRSLGMTHPTVVELDDGTLLAYLRPRQGGHVYETRSSDRGLSWSRAEQTDIPNPNAGFDMVRTDDGNLVLVINPVPSEDILEGRNRLTVMLSEDDGETWPYQYDLEHVETDASLRSMSAGERPEFTYGNVIQGRDGTIHVAYEHRRRGIRHVETTGDEIRERGGGSVAVEALLG